MTKQKILVVDDEESLCEILKFNLAKEGYEVDIAYSAEEALKKPIKVFDLILLDVMMGEVSGFKMAQMLKEDPETAIIPIIFCTAKDTEDDTIKGFNLGADDYISKPFSIKEVLARVKSVLNRTSAKKPSMEILSYHGLVINTKNKTCKIDDENIELTKKEYDILVMLLSYRGVIFSRDDILKHVWKSSVVVLDRTIDVNITRLRKKLKQYGKHIVTRSGYGYGFEE